MSRTDNNATEEFKTKLYKISFANTLLRQKNARFVLDSCSNGSILDPKQVLRVRSPKSALPPYYTMPIAKYCLLYIGNASAKVSVR